MREDYRTKVDFTKNHLLYYLSLFPKEFNGLSLKDQQKVKSSLQYFKDRPDACIILESIIRMQECLEMWQRNKSIAISAKANLILFMLKDINSLDYENQELLTKAFAEVRTMIDAILKKL